eukprot:4397398-Amphidinium_carterae.1
MIASVVTANPLAVSTRCRTPQVKLVSPASSTVSSCAMHTKAKNALLHIRQVHGWLACDATMDGWVQRARRIAGGIRRWAGTDAIALVACLEACTLDTLPRDLHLQLMRVETAAQKRLFAQSEHPARLAKKVSQSSCPPTLAGLCSRHSDGSSCLHLRPNEIHAELAEQWQQLWLQRSTPEQERWLTQQIPQGKPQKAHQLDADQLVAALRLMKDGKAMGADHMCVEHFRLLTQGELSVVAYFFTLAERMGHWPKALQLTKTVFLPKEAKAGQAPEAL